MKRVIPHSRPHIDEADVRAVARVLRSGHIAQGSATGELEARLSEMTGARGAVAVSSGTAAIYLSLKAMGVGPGDEVAMPSFICSAPAHAALLAGAEPVLCDVDPDTFNLDPDDLKKRLTPKTACVIAAHLFGLPARLDEILALGVPVLEDCAMSLGSTYRDRPTGSFGEAAVFSFYATKVVAGGEGGAVVSRNEVLLKKAGDLREYDEKESFEPGFNFKTTDLASALVNSQLDKLERFVLLRRLIARRYLDAWQGLAGLPRLDPPGSRPNFYRFVLGLERPVEPVLDALAEMGVIARRPVFRPLHKFGLGRGEGFPGADKAFSGALSVPIYPSLTEDEIQRVIESVKEALGA